MNEVKQRSRSSATRATTRGAARSDLVPLLVALCVPGAVSAWWLAPRAAPPIELPPLVLASDEAAAARAAAIALAATEPTGGATGRRRDLYHEMGVAELRGAEPPAELDRRHALLGAAMDAIVAEHGEEAIAAMRAADVERGLAALADADMEPRERAGAIGGFPRALERWGAMVDGRVRAPEIVLRALFAARWNAIHRRPSTDGLAPIERAAYHGWLALEAPTAPTALRHEALARFAEAGGHHALEARAFLAWGAGELDAAAELYDRASAATSSIRLRNHALACRTAGLSAGDEP